MILINNAAKRQKIYASGETQINNSIFHCDLYTSSRSVRGVEIDMKMTLIKQTDLQIYLEYWS